MISVDLLGLPSVTQRQLVADLSDLPWFPAELHPCMKEIGVVSKDVNLISSPRNIFVNNQVIFYNIATYMKIMQSICIIFCVIVCWCFGLLL
jgi:hypothetical protein